MLGCWSVPDGLDGDAIQRSRSPPGGRALSGGVRVYDYAQRTSLCRGESEGNLSSVEEALSASGNDREDPEVELVDKIVFHQREVELPRAELQDVLAGLFFQLGDFAGYVILDERGIPFGLLQRR